MLAATPAFAVAVPIASAGQAPAAPAPAAPPPAAPAVQPPAAPAGQPPSPPATAGQGVTPRQVGATLPLCGGLYQIGAPSRLPPEGSAPVVYQVGPCFEKQGGSPVVDANTYLYYMQMTQHVSVPSNNRWVPYDDKVEQVMLADFKRLWATNFLDDLAVETHDYKFSNGVIGKVVLYQMEERQRVKIVDYVGSKQIETLEDRRGAEEAEHADRARLLHRPGADPPRRRRRPQRCTPRRATSTRK